jgi:uncharacterized protein (DUF885 family)
MADRAFDRFRNDLFECFLDEYPTWGTWMGLHQYDGKFAKYDPASIRNRRRRMAALLKRAGKFKLANLEGDDRVDAELARRELAYWLYWMERLPDHQREPSAYVNEILFGLYVLIQRGAQPKDKRARNLLRRMRQVPRVLREAMVNLENPPKEFTESAILEAQGALGFLQATVPAFIASLRGAEYRKLRDDLRGATERAEKVFARFIAFLQDDLLPRSQGKFAVGKPMFNYILKNHHHVDEDADSLLRLGRKYLRETKAELAKVARQLSRTKSWERLVNEIKRNHPSNAQLVNYYAKEMKRARDFVRQHKLVTIPRGEKLRVVPTPAFAAPVIPYAAYLSPATYEAKKEGFFWVTQVPAGTPRGRAKEQLEGHPRAGIVVTALHEAYPGHHLQITTATYHPDKLRHLFGTSVFVEGWALYCEEMMWEQGFYSDPRSRLLQLKDTLWRACRVIIDVSLHTGKMSFDQAVKFLVKEAKLEEVNAIAEVRRYCQTPTQPMSYLMGKKLILELRRDYEQRAGKKFNLRRFHDQLLSHGSIPVKYVRELMRM